MRSEPNSSSRPLDLTVEEVRDCRERALAALNYRLPNYDKQCEELFAAMLNALIESKRLAERGNTPGIGGIPNNHSNYDRDSKVGD